MSKTLVRLLVAGVVVIVAIRIFRLQERLGENVIGRLKTKDPEQVVIAAALTVGLGLVAVVGATALRSVASAAR